MILVNDAPDEEGRITVRKLIEMLQRMPQDASIASLYDGFCEIEPNCIWLARNGHVVMADYDSVVYHDEDRPEEASDGRWETPSNPTHEGDE